MNEILLKVDEIITTIKSSSDYQKYLELQEIMKNDSEIKALISDIKSLQKRAVRKEDVSQLLEQKKEALNNNPLYREYNNTLLNLNNVLSIIENTLNNYFSNKLN